MGALGVKAGVLAILESRKRERKVDERRFQQGAIYILENPPFRLVHHLRSLAGGLLQEPVGGTCMTTEGYPWVVISLGTDATLTL